MIVVDTNVLAYLFISGERSDICERVLRKDAEWVAPALWRSEFRNVLSLYLQKGYLKIEKAIRIADAAMAMMEHNEYEVASAQALTLAARHGCSAYDAEFVVLANHLDVSLVTVDKQLLKKFPGVALSPDEFLNPQNRNG